jgi:hypothetical protein
VIAIDCLVVYLVRLWAAREAKSIVSTLEDTTNHFGNPKSKENMIYAFIPCTENTMNITIPTTLPQIFFSQRSTPDQTPKGSLNFCWDF